MAEDMDMKAYESVAHLREGWLNMAREWRRLQVRAILVESLPWMDG